MRVRVRVRVLAMFLLRPALPASAASARPVCSAAHAAEVGTIRCALSACFVLRAHPPPMRLWLWTCCACHLRSVNWYRLAFIFLPAAIRGDIMYLSFFLPFLFGPILQRVVRTFVTLYDKTDNIKVNTVMVHNASVYACPQARAARDWPTPTRSRRRPATSEALRMPSSVWSRFRALSTSLLP